MKTTKTMRMIHKNMIMEMALMYCIKFFRHVPEFYTKNQLKKINYLPAEALERENQICNSIDYLIIEAAASGYFTSDDIYLIGTVAAKKYLKLDFEYLKKYKSFVEHGYQIMNSKDIVKIKFNLKASIKFRQYHLNHYMELYALIRKQCHIPVEKLHIYDDSDQAISA